jgi:hypothetical protein
VLARLDGGDVGPVTAAFLTGLERSITVPKLVGFEKRAYFTARKK